MENNINNLYKSALYADISYVDFNSENQTGNTHWGYNDESSVIDSATGRMTDQVSKDFFSENDLISQYINPVGGFSASAFKDSNGHITIAIKGSKEIYDFISDTVLAVTPIVSAQVYQMVNWWLQITTPKGQYFDEVSLIPSDQPNRVEGLGLILPTDISEGLSVTGHSLGGYLAASFSHIFAAKYPSLDFTTFNAPGYNQITNFFGAGSSTIFNNIKTQLNLEDVRNPYDSNNNFIDPQNNAYAQNGFNLTTNDSWFIQEGDRIGIFNEESTGVLGSSNNHFMYKMTDYLSLASLMKNLDNSLTNKNTNRILESIYAENEKTLESTLDSIGKILIGRDFETIVGDSSDSTASRLSYYINIKRINDHIKNLSISGKIKVMPANDPSINIRSDFLTFLSIINSSQVILSSDDRSVEQLVSDTNLEIYDLWKEDMASIESGLNKPLNFTDDYLYEKLHLLKAMDGLGLMDDIDGNYQGGYFGESSSFKYTDYSDEALSFHDAITSIETKINSSSTPKNIIFGNNNGQTFNDSSFTNSDKIFAGSGNDVIYGYGGNDYIEGGGGNDYIYGGSGNDIINGGTGNNTLDGGSGRNIFVLNGIDRVIYKPENYADFDSHTTLVLMGSITNDGISIVKIPNSNGNFDLEITYGDGRKAHIEDYGLIQSRVSLEINGNRMTGEKFIELLTKGNLDIETEQPLLEGPEDKSGFVSTQKLIEALSYIPNDLISASFYVPDTKQEINPATGNLETIQFQNEINSYVLKYNTTLKSFLLSNMSYLTQQNVHVTYDTIEKYYFNLDDAGEINSIYDQSIVSSFMDSQGNDIFRLGDSNYTITKNGVGAAIFAGNGDSLIEAGLSNQVQLMRSMMAVTEPDPSFQSLEVKLGNGNNTIRSKSLFSKIDVGSGRNEINLNNSKEVTLTAGDGQNQVNSTSSNKFKIKTGLGQNWIHADKANNSNIELNGLYDDVTMFDAGNIQLVKNNGVLYVNLSAVKADIDSSASSSSIRGSAIELNVKSSSAYNDLNVEAGVLNAELGSGTNNINTTGTYHINIDGGQSNITTNSGVYSKNSLNKTSGGSTTNLSGGYNTISLGGGVDNITAKNGFYDLKTGAGDDKIFLQDASVKLDAGSGNDTISFLYDNGGINPFGSKTNDISGGAGDDTIIGSTGSDLYRYSLGDGKDTISAVPNSGFVGYDSSPGADKIVFGAGISLDDLIITKNGWDMDLTFKNNAGSIKIKEQFHVILSNGTHQQDAMYITSIEFANGTVLNQQAIAAAVADPDDGGDEGDGGDGGDEEIHYDETWTGTNPSDEYKYGFDGRIILIDDNDTSSLSNDAIDFGDIDVEDLWFDLVDDDLRISRISKDEDDAGFITIKNWDKGTQFQVELFEAGDYRVSNRDLDVLIQAMSAFDAPMGDTSHMSPEELSGIHNVIMATWTQRD